MASLKEGRVFSGANWQYPRCPITSGRGVDTTFDAGNSVSAAFIVSAPATKLITDQGIFISCLQARLTHRLTDSLTNYLSSHLSRISSYTFKYSRPGWFHE